MLSTRGAPSIPIGAYPNGVTEGTSVPFMCGNAANAPSRGSQLPALRALSIECLQPPFTAFRGPSSEVNSPHFSNVRYLGAPLAWKDLPTASWPGASNPSLSFALEQWEAKKGLPST